MSANRLTDSDQRETRGDRREDMLRLVRQRLSQSPRIVRLSGRIRRAVGIPAPGAVAD